MGRLVAEGLLAEGHTIGIAGRRTELLEEIRQKNPSHVFTQEIDVTSSDAPAQLLSLIERMGGIDLYFHSSGYGKYNPELDPRVEYQTVLTNCLGFTQMVDTAFNYFRDRGTGGHIAVISSVAGTRGLGAAPSYAASKRFDWNYIESLAQLSHMQKLNIQFTDIRPGFVATDFLGNDHYPLMLEPQYVARHILSALHHHRRRVTIDWRYRILCFFWRYIPNYIWERLPIHN